MVVDQTTLDYRPYAAEAAKRLTALWSRTASDRIFADMKVQTEAMRRFAESHEDGPCERQRSEDRIVFWDKHLRELSNLEDDSVPFVYLTEFDQGIYAAALGAPIEYMMHSYNGWISSMTHPILDDFSDMSLWKLNPDAPILLELDDQLDIYSSHARGKFLIASFILIDAMNFVVEVRGATQAFIDTFERPDEVTRLMDFAYDLNVYIQERVQKKMDMFCGGIAINKAGWAPGTPVLFSIDAYHLAGPDFYYQWGEPHLQKILDHFSGGVLHIHSNGHHLIEHAAKLKNLVGIDMQNEDWNPRSYELLGEIKQKSGDVPIMVECHFDELERDIDAHSLPGNTLYKVVDAPSVEEANRLMKKVRDYRV